MVEQLTPIQAYKAMLVLLDRFYFEWEITELGQVLGELRLLKDGQTADPAAWGDWLQAIEAVLAETNEK